MKAFNDSQQLKDELLVQLKHHQDLDAFVQDKWLTDIKVEGNGFKGCFYGCTMQTKVTPREAFSEKYDIDLWYCYLTENLFEGLPDGEYQKFPYESIDIIPIGYDFNKVKSAFERGKLLKMLEWVTDETVIDIIHQCADLFLVPFNEIDMEAAKSAALSAWSAAWSAAESAKSGAESARSAALSAARSALSVVWSARSAAESAALSAALSAAESARSADSADRTNHYVWMRDFLFECIRNNQ
jgi:hypothetical protein